MTSLGEENNFPFCFSLVVTLGFTKFPSLSLAGSGRSSSHQPDILYICPLTPSQLGLVWKHCKLLHVDVEFAQLGRMFSRPRLSCPGSSAHMWFRLLHCFVQINFSSLSLSSVPFSSFLRCLPLPRSSLLTRAPRARLPRRRSLICKSPATFQANFRVYVSPGILGFSNFHLLRPTLYR